MYSSLKGLMSGGGGTASIRRAFPVAPGESIEKGDVVTIFNNELYRNAELPVDALPRFSPDVLYLNSEEYSMVLHPIGGSSYLYIGTTQKLISVYRVEAEEGGLIVSAVKILPIYGIEGINQLQFKPISEEIGVLCYLEHNTSLWTMQTIRWNDSGLQLGEPFRTELYSSSMTAIESLSDNKFLLVWHCTKAAPWRLKASVCNIGQNDLITFEGDATEIDSAANLTSEFAFSKLSAGMFATSYWVKDSETKGTLVTRMMNWNGEMLALGEKSVISTAGSWQAELKHWVLSPVHFILSIKLDTTLTFHPITLREAANIPVNGGPSTGNVTDSFYDAVRISDNRFVTAVCYKESGALVLNLFDTKDGNIKQITGKAVLTSVKGMYSNKLTLTAVGQSLFVLTFNHEPERDYAYTQALMFKMAPDQNIIDDLNWKEQLINIWDRGANAYNFIYCPYAASGFIAAGQGRLKLFRCGWSPVRFISSGIGEFHSATGDHNLVSRSTASVVLSNGYVVIAYRERDTWHGKLSVLQPVEGGYMPIQSHTFSYSHVDNLSIVELATGVIALQYKQRITPSYDSKQLNRGSSYEELKLLTGSITSTGLSGKTTTGFNVSEMYITSQFLKLENGYLLHVGVTPNFSVTARVIRFLISDASVTFTPLDQVEYLDYQRMKATAALIGPNQAAIHTDSNMIVVEVSDNGLLCKLADKYFELNDRTTRGIIADGRGGFIQVTTHNTNGELLELTPYRFANNKLFQYAETRSVNRKTSGVNIEVGADGKAAVFYQARWENGRGPTLADPHQTMFLGLLDMNTGSNPEDRHYPFPCSEGTLPVFLPLGRQQYFCIGADPDGNQIYMTAYSDGERLSYGKPYLTPLGVAVSDGAAGQHVEVAIRGIVEIASTLLAGASYYNGQDGSLSDYPTGSKVGVAITENELLIE